MPSEPVPRVRLVAIPDSSVLVVRGDGLDRESLSRDARRFRRRFDQWGRYGVSAFLAADDEEVHVLCETRLVLFETVAVFNRADLVSEGVDVVPTFRRPHVTLANTDLPDLVRGLRSCAHRLLVNPYHGEEE
jgi:hypothetical protein